MLVDAFNFYSSIISDIAPQNNNRNNNNTYFEKKKKRVYLYFVCNDFNLKCNINKQLTRDPPRMNYDCLNVFSTSTEYPMNLVVI